MCKKTAERSLEIGDHLKHRDRKQMCKRLLHAKVAQNAPPTTNPVIIMKNRRGKRKRVTPQRRPVISEAVDTVMPPFIRNLLCIMLPKNVFQSMKHYAAFVDKVIENEDLPVHYGVLHPCCGDPKYNRVVFNVKSAPHSHKERF